MEHFELIYDLETGEKIVRQYTEEERTKAEQERIEADLAAATRQEAEAAKAAEKAALYAQLGITEDQARLLLS